MEGGGEGMEGRARAVDLGWEHQDLIPHPHRPRTGPAPCLGSCLRCDVTPSRRTGGGGGEEGEEGEGRRMRSRRRTARPHPSLPPTSPPAKMAAAPSPHPRTDSEREQGGQPVSPWETLGTRTPPQPVGPALDTPRPRQPSGPRPPPAVT